MADHIFTGITAIVALLTFLSSMKIRWRQSDIETKVDTQHISTMAAVADNTAKTVKLGTEINGRMTELLARTASDAKQQGATEERDREK
jgi:hypothetical protein